jgi:hypothetical protein
VPHPLDLEKPAYRERVLRAIAQAVNDGASSLTAVCRQCRGAFPTLISELLSQSANGALAHRDWLDEDPGMFDSALPAMPEPHPVDYEWRYAAATADSLTEYLTQRGDSIGCFGTPTVFWRLREKGAAATLFDRNEGLVRYLRSVDLPYMRVQDLSAPVQSQLMSPINQNALFDTILLDPPWYLDHMLVWITAALKFLRPGGNLICTLFPDLTRPAAFEERSRLLSAMESLGPVSLLPFSARYTTPLFEHETLSAFGLADLGQWRSADFVSVSVRERVLSPTPDPLTEPQWYRVQLGSQVVAVRTDLSEKPLEEELSFLPPEPDGSFLLKSVSARDPVRKNVSLWTSRNRALVTTSGGRQIFPFLSELAAGRSPSALLKDAHKADRQSLQLLLALIGW